MKCHTGARSVSTWVADNTDPSSDRTRGHGLACSSARVLEHHRCQIRLDGVASLSSARVVRCLVRSFNERNPHGILPIFFMKAADKEFISDSRSERAVDQRAWLTETVTCSECSASSASAWWIVPRGMYSRSCIQTRMALRQFVAGFGGRLCAAAQEMQGKPECRRTIAAADCGVWRRSRCRASPPAAG